MKNLMKLQLQLHRGFFYVVDMMYEELLLWTPPSHADYKKRLNVFYGHSLSALVIFTSYSTVSDDKFFNVVAFAFQCGSPVQFRYILHASTYNLIYLK